VKSALRYWAAVVPSFLVVATIAARAEWALRTGTEVRLAVRPYDPMDALSGRFIAIPLEIERLPRSGIARFGGEPELGEPVWVWLERDEPFWRAVAVAKTVPERPDVVALRGTLVETSPQDQRVDYELDRFFIPQEGADPSVPQGRHTLTAVVKVARDGRGALADLLVDGEPWAMWNARQPR
jgi:uncharacterized membrane-anchored protein